MIRAAAFTLLLAGRLAAADPALTFERGRPGTADHVLAKAELDAAAVRLSGELRLTLTVEAAAPLRVEVPNPALSSASAADWKVREAGPRGVEPLPGERERWRQSFRLFPYIAGDAVAVMPATLAVRAGAATADVRVDWGDAPLSVRVTTGVAQPAASELRPPTDIESTGTTFRPDGGRTSPLVWVLAVAALVALAAVMYRLRAARRKATTLNGYQRALAELDSLSGGAVDARSLQSLADVLRRYVEFRFDKPAPRLTTQELVAELRGSDLAPADQLAGLQAVLEAGDLAKFAAASPVADAARFAQLIESARRFVRQSAPPESPAPSAQALHEAT